MPSPGGPARPPRPRQSRRVPILLPCALALAATRAQAQASLSVDAGRAHISQAGIGRSDVLTLATEGSWGARWSTASVNAIGARTPDDRWTGQGVLAVSAFTGGPLAPAWELGASVGGFGMSNDLPSMSGQMELRRYLRAGPLSAFVGAGGGATRRAGEWRYTGLGRTGVSAAAPLGLRLTGLAAYTDSRREIRIIVPGAGEYREEVPTRFADLVAYVGHERPRLALTVAGGARFTQLGHEGTPWATATATWWLVPRVALVGAMGRSLEDVVRGVPEARYASVAVRVALADRAAAFRARRPGADAGPTVSVERAAAADSAERVLVVRVRAAERVEVMGDFTEWEPAALARSGDRWTLAVHIAPGAHRLAVRIDGGPWQVPANLPPIDDEFGGRVGRVSVP